jgi:hypothetical protein
VYLADGREQAHPPLFSYRVCHRLRTREFVVILVQGPIARFVATPRQNQFNAADRMKIRKILRLSQPSGIFNIFPGKAQQTGNQRIGIVCSPNSTGISANFDTPC